MAWKRLCSIDSVEPGSMCIVKVDESELLVIRAEEGGFLVVPPSCPHMQASLCEGFFDGKLLTCAKHLWQWSVPDGTPHGQAEEGLLIYRTEEREGELYVDFADELRYSYQT